MYKQRDKQLNETTASGGFLSICAGSINQYEGGGGRGEVPGRLQRRAAGVASSGNCNIYYVSSHPCKIHFYHSSHLLCHCLTTIVCLSHILNALYKSRLCPSCKTNQLARWRDAQLRLLFDNVHAQFIPVKENAHT